MLMTASGFDLCCACQMATALAPMEAVPRPMQQVAGRPVDDRTTAIVSIAQALPQPRTGPAKGD